MNATPITPRRSFLALPIALLAGGLLGPASASAHRGGSCSITMQASSPVVTAGETDTLLGQLTCPNAVSAANESLAVYQHERGGGESSLSEVATVTTGEDGSFQLTTGPLTGKSVFIARSLLAHGGRTVVRVAPKITIEGPAASGADLASRGDRASGRSRFTFTGTVSPALAGMRVSLQGEYLTAGERWHTIAFAQLDDEGHYSITHGFRTAGELSIRALVPPRGEIATTTEPLTYDITQAQNPQLTIQSSADPIASGASATITGVAAGKASQTVALLASAHGQAFTPVAKDTTEAGGAYSFTVTPAQNTTYKVISAGARSTELFEGVRYALSVEPPPSAAQTGVPVSFTGTVVPAEAGQTVYLERRDGSGLGFHIVGTTAVEGAHAFTIAHAFDLAGSDVMRVSVPASPQTLGSTSPEFTIAVSGAPAPTGEDEEAAGLLSGEGSAGALSGEGS